MDQYEPPIIKKMLESIKGIETATSYIYITPCMGG